MGTFETAVAAYYEDGEEEDERCFEFEPLPTLLEDEVRAVRDYRQTPPSIIHVNKVK